MPTYKEGDVAHCPHCGQALDDPIEDFVIPGRDGPKSRAQGDCGHCDRLFDVEKNADGSYELTPKAGER